MLKLTNLRVALEDERQLIKIAAKRLNIDCSFIKNLNILNKAVDARKKSNISFVYSVLLEVENEKKLLNRQATNKNLSVYAEEKSPQIVYGAEPLHGEVVVVGAGPAGLISALLLAQNGYKPILIERGLPVQERRNAVQKFWQKGEFSCQGNVQFGEGGAGTFSDGKLTTRVSSPAAKNILKIFSSAGAPEEIAYENKPHIGTENLYTMTRNLSTQIKQAGGQIRYQAKLDDIITANGKLQKVVLSDGSTIPCAALVIACGHSARDTYAMLFDRGFELEAKPFSIGVRVEHPQNFIDTAQYGKFAGHAKLGAADYALVYHDKSSGRSAYSFCMCPGGVVVASASEENQVVTNGMSYYKRNSGIANSALVVGVGTQDFGEHPLAGVAFQKKWEQLAFAKAGKNYFAPAQTVGSFLRDDTAVLGKLLQPSYRPGIAAVSLREVLPSFVTNTLALALPQFGSKIKNFDHPEALLTGVETRTSAPLRILRDKESRQAIGKEGVYPAGEGAGYAGGIMSAAIDGYYTALALMKKYKQP